MVSFHSRVNANNSQDWPEVAQLDSEVFYRKEQLDSGYLSFFSVQVPAEYHSLRMAQTALPGSGSTR
jgi:hypothetical protein